MTVQDEASRFLAFWRKARTEGEAERVARYKTEVAAAFPAFWQYVVATSGGETESDARLAQVLAAFPALEAGFVEAARRAPADLSTALSAMRERFPDFDPQVDIRFLHSLGNMDGGTRVLGGRYHLLFGIDVMARIHTWGDERAFFVHELFHVYSDQKHGRDGRNPHPIESIEEETHARELPLYDALWEEGLATYVSDWAVPGASRASLLLDVPKGMEETCLANLGFLAGDFAAKLDSTAIDDYRDWFNFRSTDPRRPKRAGYCLGYLVAKKLHRRMPMSALIDLRGGALRAEIAAALPTLAEEAPR